MARYTGPKARVNRRLGMMIYESGGAARAMERRDNPPGMHTRPRRTSNYGMALREKQKIKHYYGSGRSSCGDTSISHPGRLATRAWNCCCSASGDWTTSFDVLASHRTRPQARQGVVHGHFQVNGIKVTKPSYILRPGDVVTVRRRENLLDVYRGFADKNNSTQTMDWVTFDSETLRATVQGLPGKSDISLPVDANMVVEFLSR